jgi:lipopolysaccharide transport protein LptA
MAPSSPKLRYAAALALLAAARAVPIAAQVAPAPAPSPPLSQQPINVDAASTEVDGHTNTLVFKDVVISQGGTRVRADQAHATGLNFANSRWTFEGRVRIEAEERGNLRSDQATVEFRDNHIARATVTGKPAEFEQKRTDTDQTAHGHADEIVYDVSDGTVRLSNDAWLSDGQREISAPVLVYNVRAQSMQAAAAPNSGQRVRITIPPQAPLTPPAATPAPPRAGKDEPAAAPANPKS